MKNARNRMRTVNIPLLVLLMGALATPAAAQDPEVTSADPSAAEQATVDLEVTVGGDNFGPDADVEFLVTGTEDPGGIHVKTVKRKGPKTLKVTIDVAEQATIDLFDIRVTSNGRKGRGTELFRVVKPGDLPNESGEAQDVIVEFGDATLCGDPGDPILGDSLKEDGQGPYHPSSHDRIYVGGYVQPNPPGLTMGLGGKGKNPRRLCVSVLCSGIPAVGTTGEIIDQCSQVAGVFPDLRVPYTSLRPYKLNCPEPLPNGECPDVFTMGETTQLMGYRIELAGHPGQGIPMIRIEAASAIGGEGSLTPGRCLLQHPDPAELARTLCGIDPLTEEVDHAKCNVEVTAFDDGDWWGDQAYDGENDRWTIVADDVVALICSTDIGLIGQARLTFTEYGIKEGKE